MNSPVSKLISVLSLFTLQKLGMLNIVVFVIGNRTGTQSSNPAQGCYLTSAKFEDATYGDKGLAQFKEYHSSKGWGYT